MTPQGRVARLAVLVVVVSAHQSQAGRFAASASNICALRLGAQVWQRNQRDQRQQALPARQLLATDFQLSEEVLLERLEFVDILKLEKLLP